MEEPPFLLAVQRVVRRIEIEHDLLAAPADAPPRTGRPAGLDRRLVVADLVILRRLRAAQFQAVQRALAGNRRTVRPLRLELAQQHRQQRVVPQMVVIVEVLVAQRQAKHPLADQRVEPGARSARDRDDPRSTAQTARSVRSPDPSRPAADPPASDVIIPPSNDASTRRPSTGANPNKSAIHSVRIGALPLASKKCCCATPFAESGRRCTHL